VKNLLTNRYTGFAELAGELHVIRGKIMKLKLMIMILLLTFLPNAVFSDENSIKTTGIYSNLKYSEGPGDIAGTEIFILKGGDSDEYYLLFQEAEGWTKPPILLKPSIIGNIIGFEVTQTGYSQNGKESKQIIIYTGRITKDGLELEGQNPQTKIKWKQFLKRKNSYWQ